jgi:hypothetical protein
MILSSSSSEVNLVGWVVSAISSLFAGASVGRTRAARASGAAEGLVLGGGTVAGAFTGGAGPARASGAGDGVLGGGLGAGAGKS